jgi:BirA family transcriptional regulator, biotin operon repressor / biotin---[acetyl-CoA-carboxylase] ligase
MIIGSNLLFFENLPSTNTFTADLLRKKKVPEGTIVYTNFQQSGRGYSENKWESEDGKNLLISVVLFPSFIKPTDQFYLSISVSLGICDFLKRYIPDCFIKWPNDIYVNNDKIAGILIESSITADNIDSAIAGIGLNMNQEKFMSNAPNPVSLRMVTGTAYDLTSALNDLAKDLDKRYKQLISDDLSQLKEEYISKLYRINEWHKFTDPDGSFTGRIITLGDYGRIKVQKQNGKIYEYGFKELEFIL